MKAKNGCGLAKLSMSKEGIALTYTAAATIYTVSSRMLQRRICSSVLLHPHHQTIQAVAPNDLRASCQFPPDPSLP